MNQNSYSYEDLIQCGKGELFGPGNAQLPQPPMLMFDRITSITENGGDYGLLTTACYSIKEALNIYNNGIYKSDV